MSIIESALMYAEKSSFSIIPVRQDKKPFIKWEEYQTRKATREEIIGWWTKWPTAMIGIVTGTASGLFIMDCDTQEGYDAVQKLIPESMVIPVARTPRGGWHLYFLFLEELKRILTIGAGILPGVDYRGNGGYIVAPPSNNGNGKSYTWLPELSLDDVVPPTMPDTLLNFLISGTNNYTFSKKEEKKKESNIKKEEEKKENSFDSVNVISNEKCRQVSSLSSKMFEDGRRDNDLFHTANFLVKGGMPKDEIVQILERLIISWGEESDTKWINAKIESALKRADRRERNLAEEVREWILSSNGVFLSSDVSKCLHLSSRDEQKNLSKIFSRLCDEGLIEKYGSRNGQFKTIDNTEELIDWKNADITPLNIKFPLGVHELVQVHKGNIIVIAGESNGGKTAYCLNMAIKNSGNFSVNYLSSEMRDGTELRIRQKPFNLPDSAWEPIKFQFRTDNFPEKIKPDGFNIIDYLDEGTDSEAYKMPMRLRLIADKLKAGIAVIAIQKDPNKMFGLGGAGTLNRARVYLTIKRQGILTIEKAKIWRDENDNPNGKWIEFKLVKGCKFIEDGEWRTP